MSGSRPNNHPVEALQAPPAARNYPALEALLSQADLRIQAARDGDEWVCHYKIWMELHRLAYGPEPGETTSEGAEVVS